MLQMQKVIERYCELVGISDRLSLFFFFTLEQGREMVVFVMLLFVGRDPSGNRLANYC